MRREFVVQGSAPEPYHVTFEKEGNRFNAYCTCPAGQNGMHCKHRLNILKGSAKKILSDNHSDVEEVVSWLPETDLEKAINQLERLEKEAAKIKKQLSIAKKQLAQSMYH
jgi:uncharacterized Zn finger protein